jgi:hypothetical protein
MTYRNLPITYELCFDPRDQDVLIYRSIPAGICGPFSESAPCESRAEAEAFARMMGYALISAWESHANYDSADLTRLEIR